MSRERAHTTDALGSADAAPDSWATRFAHWLSLVVNPLILPPLLFGLVLAHLGASVGEISWAVSVGFVFFALLPLAYVVRMLRGSQIASMDIPDRARRWRPLLVSIGAYLVALGVLWATAETAGALLTALAALHVGNALLVLAVTLRWKISVHTASLGGFISMLLFVAQTPWPDAALDRTLLSTGTVSLLLVLLGVLTWARVHLHAHTPGQAVTGALFGLVMPYTQLSMLASYGLV